MKLHRELSDLPYAAALIPFSAGGLAAGEDYDGCHFDGLAFADAEIGGSRFMECAFSDVTFEGLRGRKSRFSEVWLRDVRLLSADLADSSWLDVTFVGCAAAGVQAFGASLRRVTFHECKLDSVNFRTAVLAEVTFENCLVRDVDFGSATVKRARFPGSTLTRADFSRATLEKVDLRGAELDITAGFESLRGAIISTPQLMSMAPTLAHQLGIQVKDS
jgi:uncharacterized protein YjbI with pentapeptide repeats